MSVESLVQICLNTVVDNLDYLGCVGDLDEGFLSIILSHCNIEQLRQIEDSNSDRDLGPITDELWHGFFFRKYGLNLTETIKEKMKSRNVSISWRKIYHAKVKEEEKTQDQCVERLKELYQEANQQRQTRQTLICSKLPPETYKRKSFLSSSSSSSPTNNSPSQLMKKARLAYANSLERKARFHSNNQRSNLNFKSNQPKHTSESSLVSSQVQSSCRQNAFSSSKPNAPRPFPNKLEFRSSPSGSSFVKPGNSSKTLSRGQSS